MTSFRRGAGTAAMALSLGFLSFAQAAVACENEPTAQMNRASYDRTLTHWVHVQAADALVPPAPYAQMNRGSYHR